MRTLNSFKINKMRQTIKGKTLSPHRFASLDNRVNDIEYCLTQPQSNIYRQITQIKPFSLLNKSIRIDKKLQQIFHLHKQKLINFTGKIHSYQKRNIFNSDNQKRNLFDKDLKQKCIRIINKRSINKIQKFKRLKSQSSGILDKKQDYDDLQKQLASQLINQTKRQKKIFQNTMDRIQTLIQNAQVQYAKKYDLAVNLKDIRKYGLRNLSCKDRVCTQFQSDQNITINAVDGLQVNKQDIHSWIRSSKKFVNIANLSDNKKIKDKFRIPHSFRRTNDFLYKRYFKKNNERKIILNNSLEIQ